MRTIRAHVSGLLSLLGDPRLKKHVSKLSDEPDGTQRERFLRNVGEQGDVELLDSVRLQLGSVAHEADERRQDLLSHKVARLSEKKGAFSKDFEYRI